MGDQGLPGPTGGQGIPGTPGLPGPVTLYAGGPAVLTTALGGVADIVALLPLSGQLAASNTDPDVATQVVPNDVTFTTLRGRIVVRTALSLLGTTLSVTATLFGGSGGNSPQPITTCVATPSLTGIISIGTVAEFACTGLAIPFAAGNTGYIELSLNAAGLTLINTLSLQATVSLGGE